MEFNYNDSDKKKKIITIAAIMIIACIIIAVVIFIMTNEDLFTNNPSNSSTPSNQQTGSENPATNSSDPTASNNARQPKEIKIRYENDMLIFEGLSKECEFNTVFENNKDYIFDEYRYPDDTKKTSWYDINNKSTLYFSILLDEYNTYQYLEDAIFPDNAIVQKIEITKNLDKMSLDIKVITDRCIAVTDIETTSSGMQFSLSEVQNKDFFNYSNLYSRKFFFIPEYQLCKQSDSTIIYYEDNIDDSSGSLYTIRFPAKAWSSLRGRTVTYDLSEEKIYINDGFIEYMEVKKEEISGTLYYRVSFAFQKEIILYPNSNTIYSTLTFCDPNIDNIIFIDAGHGGHDPGAESRNDDKINESDINLGICVKIEQILKEKGYNIYMTRNEDIYLGFALERGDLANIHNAKLFLSVHVDSYTEESAKGLMTIWRDEEDKSFAQTVQKNIVKTAIASDRGLFNQQLAVHARANCPAATVEVGFITNPTESEKLKSDEYQQKLAQGIANGIIEYLGLMDNAE
ncbi:MAG: N-acetylmuramoyl-L-alanine amidase [Clostridia bacterium]|jgi:N-acetylmuramoyl-L-alanine amidase|nr:N-acetylmuramoyl-L-alanine amidase [Clostridiaceae bacterium]